MLKILNQYKDTKEKHISLELYGDYNCNCCSFLSCVKKYKRLLKRILSGKLSPTQLVNVQETIVEVIQAVNNDDFECEYFDKKLVSHMYRMLVNLALQIYVIGLEPYRMTTLTISNYHWDLYNPHEVTRMIDVSRQLLNDNPNQFIVIADLCLGNIQYGDLLIKRDGEIIGAEVKEGEKNQFIMDLVIRDEDNPFSEDKDVKHFERVKRQWIRGEKIKERLSAGMDFDGDAEGIYYGIPYFIDGIADYSDRFKEALMGAYEHYYKEIRIDDAISIITVNDAAYRSSQHEMAPPCLHKLFKQARMRCCKSESYIEDIAALFNQEESDEGELLFLYNEVMFIPGMIQPCFWGATEDMMINLLFKSIQIYIIIRIEVLFDYLRNHGLKVYPKKWRGRKVGFRYKNKYWAIEERGEDNTTSIPVLFSVDHLYRMAYGLYTSEGIKDYLKNSIDMLKRMG